ncbi:MAG: nucleotidyltransferase family protein [Elusimicrobiota bacterium]|jgi:hypothetical protein
MKSPHKPAFELQLLCKLLALRPSQEECLSDLRAPGFCWDLFLQLAEYHGVIGFLYEALTETGLAREVPPKLLEALRHSTLVLLEEHLQHRSAIRKTLETLNAAGLEFIVIKGWSHAESLHGNPCARPITDLDLLVHDTKAAQALLKQQRLPDPSIVDWHIYPTNTSDLPSRMRCLQLDIQTLWADSRLATITDTPARVLSPADQVIALVIDFTISHGFGRLLLLKEILLLAEKVGWDALVKRAQLFQADILLYLTLRMGEELLRFPVPLDILKILGTRLRQEEHWLEKRLIQNPLFTPARYFCIPILLPSWADRLSFAKELLWPPPYWFELRSEKPSLWRHLIHDATLIGKACAILWNVRGRSCNFAKGAGKNPFFPKTG